MLGAQVALSVYLPATGLKRSELELVLGPITFLRVCGRSGGAGLLYDNLNVTWETLEQSICRDHKQC